MTKPTTIAEAFDLWTEENHAAHATAEPAEIERHLARAHDLAKLAVALPASTAADVWHLIRMTTDGPDDALNVSHGWVIARAHEESAEVAA